MTHFFKYTFFFTLILLISWSCRKEVIVDKKAPDSQGFVKSENVAKLIKETTLHDGSFDNIIDHANNFSIKMPYTVIVNGQLVTINDTNDLQTVEDILDASDTDTDSIEIVFPITIILSDYTEVTIHNQHEFDSYVAQSTGENEPDDDIECIDFIYPITAHIYNTVTEQTRTVSVHSDEEFHDLLDNLDDNDLINLDFPIDLTRYDGSQITVNNISELETVIENNQDACDEDDDNDHDDDDCGNCTTTQITAVLTGCPAWTIDELERQDNDLESHYAGYTIQFFANGDITVTHSGSFINGSWSVSGSGSNIYLSIDITALPDFSANWHLEEIKQNGMDKKVKLKVDDDNKMKIKSHCP